MKRRHTLLAAADRELDDQVAWYVEHAGPRVATRFYEEFKAAVARLLRRPRAGRLFLSPRLAFLGVRTWPMRHFPFLIFYRETDRGIELLHLRHGARDHGTLRP